MEFRNVDCSFLQLSVLLVLDALGLPLSEPVVLLVPGLECVQNSLIEGLLMDVVMTYSAWNVHEVVAYELQPCMQFKKQVASTLSHVQFSTCRKHIYKFYTQSFVFFPGN